MKTIRNIISAAAAAVVLSLSSCVGDLNVTPIDPNMNTADKALVTEDDFVAFLAQVYTGFSTSGSYGPNGDCNISGVDGGYSQYLRGLYHLEELTTDVSVCGWSDKTIADLHAMCWTTTDIFVYSIYTRIFYQVAMCNEFIRQANATSVEMAYKAEYIAEARALRAYCWLHAIDLFGNVPFADETSVVGAALPEQISRADLFKYIEKECQELLESDLSEAVGNYRYERANKDFVRMVLAKLYLNAEVFIGEKKYDECAKVLKSINGYSLHNKYQELFLADNNVTSQDEIIFAFQFDGKLTQSYGGTNYIIFASTGGKMDAASVGISSGWGGIRATPEFYDLFPSGDTRALFYTGSGDEDDQQKDIVNISDFKYGYATMKFKNINSDGTAGQEQGFVDTDFPVFRYADVLLMLAECGLRGCSEVTKTQGTGYINQVRGRAGIGNLDDSSFTEQELINERGRELYQECWRRQDLIRFGMFTTNKYIWQWKGGVHDGRAVSDHLNLFPIPESDRIANSKLAQNAGY